MISIQLDFPTLVEERDSQFILTPLLTRAKSISNSRYQNAIRSLRRSIKKDFENQELSNHDIHDLLWYCFQPKIKFELPLLIFKSGHNHVQGLFALVYYSLNGHEYVCLPKFNHLTVRLPSSISSSHDKQEHIIDIIRQYFREERKAGKEVIFRDYTSEKSDTHTQITGSIQIETPKLPFDEDTSSRLSMFFNNPSFKGARELPKVGISLNEQTTDGLGKALYRDRQSQLLQQSLFGQSPQAIVLIGKPGIGRTNLLESTLRNYLIDHADTAESLLQQIWLIDPNRVISGMSVVGQWERRFEAILERLKTRLADITNGKLNSPDIMYVDNPVALLRIGKSAQTSLTLAHLLKPRLEKREFPLVLEATQEEWQKVQQLDRAFADFFQVIRVEPLSSNQLTSVYIQHRAKLEIENGTNVSAAAMLTILKNEPRFRGDAELPGTALSLLEAVVKRSKTRNIDSDQVYQSIETQFNFKTKIIQQHHTLNRNDVKQYFTERLIGQQDACNVLTDTVLGIKSQVSDSSKPLNTMLFVGPTGVGKTEAAKQLADYLFDRTDCLVRIDMNEFSDSGAVERLIGNRFHPQGILTERVRYIRSCVLLLDEIEKADSRVHDLLLQLLDDARLTDASGRTCDFSQCVVIMTSNLGASEAATQIGFAEQDQHDSSTYLHTVERFFRPELINRINHKIPFQPLQLEDMEYLAKLHLQKLLMRDGFTRRKTVLNVDPDCLKTLAQQDFDTSLGARGLKRNLERSLTRTAAARLSQFTTSDPVIIHAHMKSAKVHFTFTELVYVKPSPTSILSLTSEPEFDHFKFTLDHLENSINTLRAALDKGDSSLQAIGWKLSDSIRDISEPLQRFIWEKEERDERSSSNKAFKFRMPRVRKVDVFGPGKFDTDSAHAKRDMHDYLKDFYINTDAMVTKELQHSIQLFSEAAVLTHAAKKLTERGTDQATLRFCVLNSDPHSHKLTQVLSQRYINLVEDYFGTVESIEETPNTLTLRVEGCGIHELFEYEAGVHLFIGEQFRHVPIQLDYFNSKHPPKDESLPDKLEVVRLYDINNSNDGYVGIVDLRTQATFKSDQVDDHMMLLAEAIHEQLT